MYRRLSRFKPDLPCGDTLRRNRPYSAQMLRFLTRAITTYPDDTLSQGAQLWTMSCHEQLFSQKVATT